MFGYDTVAAIASGIVTGTMAFVLCFIAAILLALLFTSLDRRHPGAATVIVFIGAAAVAISLAAHVYGYSGGGLCGTITVIVAGITAASLCGLAT